jgi:hypothetical protein
MKKAASQPPFCVRDLDILLADVAPAGRKPHERCEPGPILLCMGLFSRFCVWAPRCIAEEALRCVRDTRSLVLRAHGESIQLQCIML